MRWPVAASSCSPSARAGCAPTWAGATPRWRRRTRWPGSCARPMPLVRPTAAGSSAPTAGTFPGRPRGRAAPRPLPASFLDGEGVHDLAIDVIGGVLQAPAIDVDYLVGRGIGEALRHVRRILLLVHLGAGD